MSDYKRGDLRIMRVTEVDGGRATLVDAGELVRCADCVNWGPMPFDYLIDYCPVVMKCTRPTDWCCWGARKGESDER